jgi:hypothetical protein
MFGALITFQVLFSGEEVRLGWLNCRLLSLIFCAWGVHEGVGRMSASASGP